MADVKLKTCSHCGKAFALSHNGQLYCSDGCRFWAKVARAGPDDCWMWTGTKPAFGHGQFRLNGRAVYAHRFSWELIHGELPRGDDVCVLHKCDVPACVNPSHLFVGTRKQNLSDMRNKGRGHNPPLLTGERHHSAKLTEDDVRAIRASSEGQLQLASRYGVARRTINHIINRRIWRHIT